MILEYPENKILEQLLDISLKLKENNKPVTTKTITTKMEDTAITFEIDMNNEENIKSFKEKETIIIITKSRKQTLL